MCGQNLVSQWVVKKVTSPDFPLSNFYTHIIHSHTKETNPININKVSVFFGPGQKIHHFLGFPTKIPVIRSRVPCAGRPLAAWNVANGSASAEGPNVPQQKVGQTLGREVGEGSWELLMASNFFFLRKNLGDMFFFSFYINEFPIISLWWNWESWRGGEELCGKFEICGIGRETGRCRGWSSQWASHLTFGTGTATEKKRWWLMPWAKLTERVSWPGGSWHAGIPSFSRHGTCSWCTMQYTYIYFQNSIFQGFLSNFSSLKSSNRGRF